MDPLGVGSARRDHPGGAVWRRPLDVLDRGAVAGVEEAGGPALGERAALQDRLGRRHLEPAGLEGRAHRGQVLGPPGPVEGGRRLLVLVDRLGVVAHRLLVGVGHAGVQVEGADVVGEGHQVLLGDRLDLRQLPLALGLPFAAPPPHPEDQRAPADHQRREHRHRGDHPTGPTAAVTTGLGDRFAPGGRGDLVDELTEGGVGVPAMVSNAWSASCLAWPLSRVRAGRGVLGSRGHQVGAWLVQLVGDPLAQRIGVAVGLVPGVVGQNRDVDRRTGRLHLLPQLVRVGLDRSVGSMNTGLSPARPRR